MCACDAFLLDVLATSMKGYMYIYIYLLSSYSWFIFIYTRESLSRSVVLSTATLSAYIKSACASVWPSILETACECSTYIYISSPLCRITYIYIYIYLVMLRRISRYITSVRLRRVLRPFDSRSAVHRSRSLRYCDLDTATDCPISAANTWTQTLKISLYLNNFNN